MKNSSYIGNFLWLMTFQPCTKHHFGMTKPERAVMMSDSSSSSIQKTLNSIKTAAENVKSKRVRVKKNFVCV